jgi:hypothetical protein
MVRFIERLGYHAGRPFPHSLRLMCRGAPLAEVLWLRHARALSVRRRPVTTGGRQRRGTGQGRAAVPRSYTSKRASDDVHLRSGPDRYPPCRGGRVARR